MAINIYNLHMANDVYDRLMAIDIYGLLMATDIYDRLMAIVILLWSFVYFQLCIKYSFSMK